MKKIPKQNFGRKMCMNQTLKTKNDIDKFLTIYYNSLVINDYSAI